MAFTKLTDYSYVALAADAKTTAGIYIGARLIEYDTDQEWIFDGTAWREFENIAILAEHKRVHLGHMWDISHLFIQVADDAPADIVLTVGSVELHTTFREASEGAAYGYIYEAPTVTAATGSAATVKNANRVIGDSGAPTAIAGQTVTQVGTLLATWYNTGGTGGNAQGGSASRETELDLAPSTIYLFRMTNEKGSAADMSWMIHAYEHA